MNVTGSSQSCKKIDAQALAIAVFKDDKADHGLLKELDVATGGLVSRVIETEEFKAKEGETAYFHLADSELKAQRLLLIGCGERDAYKTQQVSQMAGTAAHFLRSKNAKSVAIIPRAEGDVEKVSQSVIAGAIMGLFLSIEVLHQKRMEKFGMGSLLGVTRGSDEPLKLIVLKYQPLKIDKLHKDE